MSTIQFSDVESREFGTAKNIDQSVALVIDAEYGNLLLEHDIRDIQFGDTLANGTEQTFRRVFKNVVRVDRIPAISESQWDLIAVPRLIDLDYSGGMWAWNDTVQTIAVEWTLLDKEGKTLWAKTVKADSTNSSGTSTSFYDRRIEGFRMLFDNYYKELRQSLIEAGKMLGVMTK